MSRCMCPDCLPDEKKLAAFERIVSVLRDCEDYMDDHADADCEDGRFIGNKEMNLLMEIREALAGIP